jgi:hypothetical protein
MLAVTAFAHDYTDTPAINSGAREATELDERGIPIWWTDAPAMNSGAREATELDERGIPIWWH